MACLNQYSIMIKKDDQVYNLKIEKIVFMIEDSQNMPKLFLLFDYFERIKQGK